MNEPAGHAPNRWPWPPLLLVVAVACAWALGRIAPLPDLPQWALPLGVGLLGVGLALDLWAMAEMRQRRANILPHRSATALVTSGPFAFSRNPIYLGNTIVLLGLAGVLGNSWLIVAAPAAALAVERLAIRREEAHLAALFGEDWLRYRGRVSRWLGRRSHRS